MLNTCILAGNLGNDPEIRYTNDGKSIANFDLAFSSGKDRTGWIKVTCFNRLAELSEQHLHKGSRIAVTGSLDQEKWESNGKQHSKHVLIANSLEFIKTQKQE